MPTLDPNAPSRPRPGPPSPARPGHRVRLYFDGAGLGATLICPESGCETSNTCSFCGRDLNPCHPDEATEPCYDCKDADQWKDQCWLKTWFDNVSADELLLGEIEFPVFAEWDQDHCVVHILA